MPIQYPSRASCLALSLLFSASAMGADTSGAMKSIKDAAKAQAQSRMAEKFNLPTAAPAAAKVYLIEPKNGATVSSPVKVVFGLTGMGVAPVGTQIVDTGHHHLLIDDPQVDMTVPLPTTDQVKHYGGGQTETILTLKPGKHTLQLVFGDWKHQAFAPVLASEKISITVK